MKHHITVSFGDDQEYDFRLRDADTAGITWGQAQQWLDEEYVKTVYEAANPVGIALLADKVLRIAMARGPEPFANKTAWARQFACCTGRATGRINIMVSVANELVSY